VVTPRVQDREAGKVKWGCLFTLVVLAAGIYYGYDFLQVRLRYYNILDTVKTQANFASALDDNLIKRRLVARSDSLGLPLGTREWTVRRTFNPRQIFISATYRDSVVLEFPGIRKVYYFTFTPSATELY
jgi:hypothetical protein